MQKHTVVAIVLLVLLAVGGVVYKAIEPSLQQRRAYATSDARTIKGDIRIALDSWIGYFPVQSPIFKKMMREEGFRVVAQDDNADYAARMANLKDGTIDFAVCTVDAYLLNGAPVGFPATIIAVIDESKGGDAIVAWKDRIASIDELKGAQGFTIAFTPDSPSHHLLKAIGDHFGIMDLLDSSGAWRVETNGAEDAYARLMRGEVDMAVIWEPHVTDALSDAGIVKLLGTEDVEKLIVDILLVNRSFAAKSAPIVDLVLRNYFETMRIYAEQPELLQQDIKSVTGLDQEQVEAMLQGVKWLDLTENARWFGLDPRYTYQEEELLTAIDASIRILVESNDFTANPLTNSDPFTIIDSSFLGRVVAADSMATSGGSFESSLQRKFTALDDAQWDKLRTLGSLRLRNVTFQSGTADLDYNGQEQLDASVETLAHYPNFRVLVKGHTGVRGDPEANEVLSQQRADAVKGYFMQAHGVDPNRMRAIGMGGSEPLEQVDGESSRAYSDRLKRVEVYLVSP